MGKLLSWCCNIFHTPTKSLLCTIQHFFYENSLLYSYFIIVENMQPAFVDQVWRNFKMINILWRKGLATFTQLVKERRGRLVLALPRIQFSWNFYQIISGTNHEYKTSFGHIVCHSWQDNGKKRPFFHGILTCFWHFSEIAAIFMFQTGWSGVPQAAHT